MTTTTRIINGTKQVLKVQVVKSHCVSDLTTVEPGGKYVMGVDYNATYREYSVGVGTSALEKVIVSSDDLCDNKCIIVKEEDGKLNLHNEPRESSSATTDANKTSKKFSWIPAWMSR